MIKDVPIQILGFLDSLYNGSRGNFTTIRCYRNDLMGFLKFSELEYGYKFDNTVTHLLNKYIISIMDYEVATLHRKVSCFRSFVYYLYKNKYISKDTRNDLASIPKMTKPKAVTLTITEVSKLLNVSIAPTLADLRDKCILEFLYYCGLKTCEIVRINIEDLNLLCQTMFIKGREGRTITINSPTLYNYLEVRKYKELDSAEPLFINLQGTRLSTRSVRRSIDSYGRLTKKELTPSILRHSRGKHLIDGGTSFSDVSKFLGHSKNNVTTRIYH